MRNFILSIIVFLSVLHWTKAQESYEYTQVTTIESVVPGGLGRSRMITTSEKGNLDEIKMKNFFSLAGINFGNVRQNDELIANKITSLSSDGWELFSVNTGVYSGAEGGGIFITRYLFRKKSD